jgi:hypothetical protein
VVESVYSAVRTDCLYKADYVKSLYIISRLDFVTVVESVYSAVRNDFLYKAEYVSSLKGLMADSAWSYTSVRPSFYGMVLMYLSTYPHSCQ